MIPHITQVSITSITNGSNFNSYVIPKVQITDGATEITHITYDGTKMEYKGFEVSAQSWRDMSKVFVQWIEDTVGENKAILCAHNGRKFDSRVLMTALQAVNLHERFLRTVIGFIDTMSLLAKKIGSRQDGISQSVLFSRYIGGSYDAHDATGDVSALIQLLQHFKPSFDEYKSSSFPSVSVLHQERFLEEKRKNLPSLQVLLRDDNKVITRALAENIAGSGLRLEHVKRIYTREGMDGLKGVFAAKTQFGKPRIMAPGKKLDEHLQNLAQFFDSN